MMLCSCYFINGEDYEMRNEDFILLHFLKFALSASPAADFNKESTDRKQLCFISDFFKNTRMI